jgi:hypothetical protein
MRPFELIPWVYFAGFREAQMQEVSLSEFYRLGRALGELRRLDATQPLTRDIFAACSDAKLGMRQIKQFYPEASELVGRAWDGLEQVLDQCVDDSKPFPVPRSEHPIGEPVGWIAQWLRSGVNIFGMMLDNGMMRLRTFYLTPHRGYDANALMKDGTCVLDPAVRDAMLPLACEDIRAAARCLLVEEWTASGFHLLRAVEVVLRTYFAILPVEAPRHRNWGTYIEALQDAGVDARLCSRLDKLREYDRNVLMHPEIVLTAEVSLDLFAYGCTMISDMTRDMKNRTTARS